MPSLTKVCFRLQRMFEIWRNFFFLEACEFQEFFYESYARISHHCKALFFALAKFVLVLGDSFSWINKTWCFNKQGQKVWMKNMGVIYKYKSLMFIPEFEVGMTLNRRALYRNACLYILNIKPAVIYKWQLQITILSAFFIQWRYYFYSRCRLKIDSVKWSCYYLNEVENR